MASSEGKAPETGTPRENGPEAEQENPRVLKIILWALFLYALGLAVMVLEDLFFHTFV